jgi:hypothetical protein
MDEGTLKRIAILLCVAAVAASSLSSPAAAQTSSQSAVKAKSPAARTTAMHPHQLTLYPHGRPARRQARYSYTRHRSDQPIPTHNTFMAPRYY